MPMTRREKHIGGLPTYCAYHGADGPVTGCEDCRKPEGSCSWGFCLKPATTVVVHRDNDRDRMHVCPQDAGLSGVLGYVAA